LALVVALAMSAMAMLYVGGSPASSATGTDRASGFTRVAHSPQGFARSKIVGQTAGGQRVTGSFVPLSFSKKNGHLRARGLLQGVVHRANGTTRTFDVVRTLRVRTIDGQVPGAARAAGGAAAAKATCDILHLTLGPLDLDLLGLKVHLDRVVLDIVAQSGAGQLLGNLLCAVAGLLDGGTLGQILNQLTAILNQLLMGL
jgi:hypothetical protein